MDDAEKRAAKCTSEKERQARIRASETMEERQARLVRQRAYGVAYRQRHGEKEKARHRKAVLAAYHADREKGRERLRAARAKHGEKWTATRREKRALDPEPNRRWQRERYASNPAVREKVCVATKTRYVLRRELLLEQHRQWLARNPGYSLQYGRRWRDENRERYREYLACWRQENAGKIRQAGQAWRSRNPDYARKKYASSEQFSMACRLRSRLATALKRAALVKPDVTMTMVGCSASELLIHIEAQFTNGMSWDNRSEWHVDHIKPVCSFDLTDPEQQGVCFHYTNLRPLWARDNLTRPRPRAARKEAPNPNR